MYAVPLNSIETQNQKENFDTSPGHTLSVQVRVWIRDTNLMGDFPSYGGVQKKKKHTTSARARSARWSNMKCTVNYGILYIEVINFFKLRIYINFLLIKK